MECKRFDLDFEIDRMKSMRSQKSGMPSVSLPSPKIPSSFRSVMSDRAVFCQRLVSEPQIHLIISCEGRIDESRLARAVRLSLDAEPVLGCRFRSTGWWPRWERREDLDSLARCGVLETPHVDAETLQFLITPMDPFVDPQVQVRILRSAADRVCIKVNHIAADAGGVKEYGYFLTSLYRSLAGDPGFVPVPNLRGSRSLRQVSRRFSFLQKLGILKAGLRDLFSDYYPFEYRMFPSARGKSAARTYGIRRLGPELVQALKAYGARHQATINDMVVAALYRVLQRLIRPPPKAPLRMLITSDLRRHLPSGRGEAICNLSGFVHLNSGLEPGSGFYDTVSSVQELMNRKKANYLGLGDFALVGPLMKWLPFSWVRKSCGQWARLGSKKGTIPPVMTNLGIIRSEDLFFNDTEICDAYLTAPIIFPPFFAMGVSGFRDSITMSIGCCETGIPREVLESVLDSVEEELKAVCPTDLSEHPLEASSPD